MTFPITSEHRAISYSTESEELFLSRMSPADRQLLRLLVDRVYLRGQEDHALGEERRSLTREKKQLKAEIIQLQALYAAEQASAVEKANAKVRVIYDRLKSLIDELAEAVKVAQASLNVVYKKQAAGDWRIDSRQFGEDEAIKGVFLSYRYLEKFLYLVEPCPMLNGISSCLPQEPARSEERPIAIRSPGPAVSSLIPSPSALSDVYSVFQEKEEQFKEKTALLKDANARLREKRDDLEKQKVALQEGHAKAIKDYHGSVRCRLSSLKRHLRNQINEYERSSELSKGALAELQPWEKGVTHGFFCWTKRQALLAQLTPRVKQISDLVQRTIEEMT